MDTLGLGQKESRVLRHPNKNINYQILKTILIFRNKWAILP